MGLTEYTTITAAATGTGTTRPQPRPAAAAPPRRPAQTVTRAALALGERRHRGDGHDQADSYPLTLTRVDRGAIWARLALSIKQVTELTGLSWRQINYWTARGYLTPISTDPLCFDGPTIERALYIKQGLAAGLSVRRAVVTADEFLTEQAQTEPVVRLLRSPVGVELEAQVRSAADALAPLLEVLTPAADALPSQATELA